eukprot:1854229-Pyramimonas_sp.AAC.1
MIWVSWARPPPPCTGWCPLRLPCGPSGTLVRPVEPAGVAAPWSSTGPLPRAALVSSRAEAAVDMAADPHGHEFLYMVEL